MGNNFVPQVGSEVIFRHKTASGEKVEEKGVCVCVCVCVCLDQM